MEDFFSFLKDKENIMLLLDGLTFVAGLFALWLFYRRNRSFEKQVDTGQKQVAVSQEQTAISQKQAKTSERNLFNDRLSRGIEALGHEELAVRQAGLYLLHQLELDLDEKMNQNPPSLANEERILIKNIFSGFIRSKAPRTVAMGKVKSREERFDIELGVDLLFRLYAEETDGLNYPLSDLDFRGLNFKSLNLQSADFRLSIFSNASFIGTTLISALLDYASFDSASLIMANLGGASFINTTLKFTDITRANFSGVQHLTQIQLDRVVYQNLQPPMNLADGLTPNSGRAYEWARNENGQMCRRFVHNKEWIDKRTPWWFEGGEDDI